MTVPDWISIAGVVLGSGVVSSLVTVYATRRQREARVEKTCAEAEGIVVKAAENVVGMLNRRLDEVQHELSQMRETNRNQQALLDDCKADRERLHLELDQTKRELETNRNEIDMLREEVERLKMGRTGP